MCWRSLQSSGMTSIASLVDAAGGLLHKRDLVLAGARDRHLTNAVRQGDVRRPRRGWYSTWPPDDPKFIAVRVGGRLTGLAALRSLMPWRWARRPVPIVVSVPRNAARLRHQPGVRVVYDPPAVQERGTPWQVDEVDAFARAVLESTFEEAVALIDWAMRTFALTRAQLAAAIARLPADARRIEAWTDIRCDSFPESISRTRFRLRGHDVRSQRQLPNGQRVDLVVDGRIGIEVDGREHHAATFESDRRKDLLILRAGLIPVRLTVAMVRDAWAGVERAVETVAPRRRAVHPRPRRDEDRPADVSPRRGDAPKRRRTWWLPR
jgi:very-short-patch-repair endonuclease